MPDKQSRMINVNVIPPGRYCYRVRHVEAGEVLSWDLLRFGKDLREYSWHSGFKAVLCPYWRRTDYGMIRCELLNVEGLDDGDPAAKEKAIAHYGTEAAFGAANISINYLPDEIKICGIREDEDEDWDSSSAKTEE